MSYQAVFQRRELKYLLTRTQKEQALEQFAPYLKPDAYPRMTIRNIYYDTAQFSLIRRSLEKPIYKEKLRVRSYTVPCRNQPVFVELKKKYRSVVYKRRVQTRWETAALWLAGQAPPPDDSQITREIDYTRCLYTGLQPRAYLSYDREAYCCRHGSLLRVTFDENILARGDGLSLLEPVGGIPLLDRDLVLMELKIPGGMPLWLAEFLSVNALHKTSFSKYGHAYQSGVLFVPGQEVLYA